MSTIGQGHRVVSIADLYRAYYTTIQQYQNQASKNRKESKNRVDLPPTFKRPNVGHRVGPDSGKSLDLPCCMYILCQALLHRSHHALREHTVGYKLNFCSNMYTGGRKSTYRHFFSLTFWLFRPPFKWSTDTNDISF